MADFEVIRDLRCKRHVGPSLRSVQAGSAGIVAACRWVAWWVVQSVTVRSKGFVLPERAGK